MIISDVASSNKTSLAVDGYSFCIVFDLIRKSINQKTEKQLCISAANMLVSTGCCFFFCLLGSSGSQFWASAITVDCRHIRSKHLSSHMIRTMIQRDLTYASAAITIFCVNRITDVFGVIPLFSSFYFLLCFRKVMWNKPNQTFLLLCLFPEHRSIRKVLFVQCRW